MNTKLYKNIKIKYLAGITLFLMLLLCASTVKAQDQDVQAEIKTLIEKIRSITFEETFHESAEVVEAVKNDQPAEPNTVESITDPNETAAHLPTAEVDLDKILRDTKEIVNAFELAELLYANKQYTPAQHCYQKAFEQLTDNSQQNNDKAWIMIQIGNCQKKTEPDKAVQTYNKIQVNYPLSLWAEYAKVQVELTKWYIKEKPNQLIAK